MTYSIYLASNLLVPFRIISDSTIDTTTTLSFIGRQQIGYGQAQDQNFLTLLTNSANATAPSPSDGPLLGQIWYNSANDVLMVCTTAGLSPTWTVVGNPYLIPPSSPSQGNLWFNTSNDVLYAWTGTEWLAIGPSSQVAPFNVYEQDYATITTTNNTSTLLWKDGINGSYLTIPSNTTWLFEIQVSARRSDSGQEFAGWKIKGVINNTSGTVAFPTVGYAPSIDTYGTTSNWSVAVTADQANTSLDITVTGENGKTINWTAVIELTKTS